MSKLDKLYQYLISNMKVFLPVEVDNMKMLGNPGSKGFEARL